MDNTGQRLADSDKYCANIGTESSPRVCTTSQDATVNGEFIAFLFYKIVLSPFVTTGFLVLSIHSNHQSVRQLFQIVVHKKHVT